MIRDVIAIPSASIVLLVVLLLVETSDVLGPSPCLDLDPFLVLARDHGLEHLVLATGVSVQGKLLLLLPSHSRPYLG